MGGNPQALLQQGLIPFLLQKAGIAVPGAPAQTQSPTQRAQAQQPQSPNFNPQLGPARSPGGPQGPPPSTPPGAGPQVSASPMAGVGNFPTPTAQPIADVRSLQGLLMGWSSRKQQKEHAEAENVAMNLMQAIEGAKQTGDWGPATEILHQNEKLLNKVYKGWLQKAEQAQAAAAKGPEKQDPGQVGFESGVGKHMAQKQAQAQPPPQAPPQGTQPKTLGGYYLPQAGPAEFAQQQAASAAAQQAKTDPLSTAPSKLTGEEQRQAALGAAGIVSTPKTEAEMEKYRAMVSTAQTNAQKAQAELQKATAELQAKRLDIEAKQKTAVTAAEKAKLTLEVERNRVFIAQANAEAAKARLALIHVKSQTPKQPSLQVKTRIDALDKLGRDLTEMEKSPPTWHFGAPPQELQDLKGTLRAAGLGALAAAIPSQAPIFTKTDVAGMLKTIHEGYTTYNDSFQQGIKENWPDYKKTTADIVKGVSDTEVGAEPSATGGPEEGETDQPDADIVVSPEDMSGKP